MSAVASAHIALMVIAQKVSAKPEAGGLPGTPVLEKLINGMLFWGLLACVAGIVLGGALVAFR